MNVKRLRAGLMAGSLAAVMIPAVAAAQCEGGSTTGGYYLSTGAYVSGGCSFTNSTTPGQLYPSGAQVAPSTNPAAGVSRLPGQRVPASLQSTLQDTVSGSNATLGPYTSTNQFQTTAGPGAQLGVTTPGMGLLPNTSNDQGATQNTLTTQLNPNGLMNMPSGMSYGYNPQFGQYNTTGFNAGNTVGTPTNSAVGTIGLSGTGEGLSGVPGSTGSALNSGGSQVTRLGGNIDANGMVTSTTTTNASYAGVPTTAFGNLAATGGLGILNLLPGQSSNNPSPAYSTTLPVAPAVTEAPQDVVNNPVRSSLPLVPGRGGPTYVGEERPARTVVD